MSHITFSIYRRLVLAVVPLLFLLIPVRTTNAQGPLSAIENRWKRGDYSRVWQELVEYRERTGDKSAKIDYMIATSACRCDRRESGYEFFQWILYNYGLSPENRSLVELEMDRCQTRARPAGLLSNAPSSLVGLSYHGESGYEFFQWILYNYGLSPENRSLVELEMGRCQTRAQPAALQSNAPSSLVGLSYHGHAGFE